MSIVYWWFPPSRWIMKVSTTSAFHRGELRERVSAEITPATVILFRESRAGKGILVKMPLLSPSSSRYFASCPAWLERSLLRFPK